MLLFTLFTLTQATAEDLRTTQYVSEWAGRHSESFGLDSSLSEVLQIKAFSSILVAKFPRYPENLLNGVATNIYNQLTRKKQKRYPFDYISIKDEARAAGSKSFQQNMTTEEQPR